MRAYRRVFAGATLCLLLLGAAAWAQQKHMQNALDLLKRAREQLDQATPHKGGHRENAIELVDKAIAQVEKGMEYEREH